MPSCHCIAPGNCRASSTMMVSEGQGDRRPAAGHGTRRHGTTSCSQPITPLSGKAHDKSGLHQSWGEETGLRLARWGGLRVSLAGGGRRPSVGTERRFAGVPRYVRVAINITTDSVNRYHLLYRNLSAVENYSLPALPTLLVTTGS